MTWCIGTAGDAIVALDASELRGHGTRVGIDALLEGAEVERDDVLVVPPRWRGNAFVELLEWLVCSRLRGRTTWMAGKREGATGVRRVLTDRGWKVDERKERGRVVLSGEPPPPGPRPEPDAFETVLLGAPVRLSAAWGVFSRGHVDPCATLLLDVAARLGPFDRAVDVGTGYGPIAIGLLAGGVCRSVVASDVDLVAAHLARRNAAAAGVEVEVVPEPDPSRLPDAELTVCFVPTHVPSDVTDLLVRGLASRSGVVLAGVHASLERRYAQRFEAAGRRVAVEARAEHVVLRL